MMRIIPNVCTGCRICEIICSLTHESSIAPKQSRVRISSNWPEEEKIFLCVACESKPCIDACPEGALSWKDYLRIDEVKCTGCFLCKEACPYGGIHRENSKNFPLFCDTCHGQFQCVQWCPTKAIVRVK
ncbi:MAG: 4Fe-4S dicluster domain-containing protein [Deltaproteobacteria bacterium]|nr:4Fe-4S dicluster domain-containing protein [Deltaproteobacteria bacterium]